MARVDVAAIRRRNAHPQRQSQIVDVLCDRIEELERVERAARAYVEAEDALVAAESDEARVEAWDEAVAWTEAMDALRAAVAGTEHGAGPSPFARGFAAGVEAACKKVESHCCVSSCCDVQPGGETARELAACVRANTKPPADDATPDAREEPGS